MNENKLNNFGNSNLVGSSIPVRETEVGRELQRLYTITENLESLKDRFYARLEGVLNGGGLKNTDDTAKDPSNSSKLGQELNTTNMRLNQVAKSLDGLLNRLEL